MHDKYICYMCDLTQLVKGRGDCGHVYEAQGHPWIVATLNKGQPLNKDQIIIVKYLFLDI